VPIISKEKAMEIPTLENLFIWTKKSNGNFILIDYFNFFLNSCINNLLIAQIAYMQPNNTFQTIDIYLSGRNFKDLDYFSKSDPYIKVSYRRDFNCKNYVVLGKT